jgi:hypothetical protein
MRYQFIIYGSACCPPAAVGYRVFLGNGKYFVSSDVGGGKMQWYGFHKEPANGTGTHQCKGGRNMSFVQGACYGLSIFSTYQARAVK